MRSRSGDDTFVRNTFVSCVLIYKYERASVGSEDKRFIELRQYSQPVRLAVCVRFLGGGRVLEERLQNRQTGIDRLRRRRYRYRIAKARGRVIAQRRRDSTLNRIEDLMAVTQANVALRGMNVRIDVL